MTSKLMDILDDWDADYIDKKQAHSQILASYKDMIPKKYTEKQIKVPFTDERYCNGFNSAVEMMESNWGKL